MFKTKFERNVVVRSPVAGKEFCSFFQVEKMLVSLTRWLSLGAETISASVRDVAAIDQAPDQARPIVRQGDDDVLRRYAQQFTEQQMGVVDVLERVQVI